MVVKNVICPAFLALEIQNCLRSLLLHNGLLLSHRVHSIAGFPLANIFARSDFFFCLNLISSTCFQPKAQGQREKVALRENIRWWKTGLMFGFMQLPQPTTPFVPFTYLVTILSNMFLVL